MPSLTWDPPVLAAGLVAAVGLVCWLALAPPTRDGRARGALRAGAALLLVLALLDVGCRQGAPAGARRLVVLIDRSLSMEVGAPDDMSRAGAARAWLASDAFREWTRGWEVAIDSFGGATTDPGAAVEDAASGLPAAIVLVSDGRAAGGRSVEPAPVPLYVRVPGPHTLDDAAVIELEIAEPDTGAPRAIVEFAAVGGRPMVGPGEVVVGVDGRAVGRRRVERLASGERRIIEFALPSAIGGPRRVEARVAMPGDAVPANDRRARIWIAGGPRRVLAVGLLPGWDFAAWLRALEREHAGVLDAYWSDGEGRLRQISGVGEEVGRAAGWTVLDPARYEVAYLVGDPNALGGAGRAWVERFLASGGRGLLWGPEGRGGRLAGVGITVPSGGAVGGVPSVPPAGRAWLTARGVTAAGPDASDAWPPLEGLPAPPPDPSPEATPLLALSGQPIAWTLERSDNRLAVLLGTGYYRWALERAESTGEESAAEEARVFWPSWAGALARWLAAASPVTRPLVHMPVGGRVPAAGRLQAMIAPDVTAAVRWRIEGLAGEVVARGAVGEGGEVAAVESEGAALAGDSRAIVAGPFESGSYRLIAESGRRHAVEPFVVETWAPDLSWTAADTASVAAAARASDGTLIGDSPRPALPRSPEADVAEAAGAPTFGLGRTPWAFLLATLLLLADWALARPRPR